MIQRGRLFQKDIFSQPSPRFCVADARERSRVIEAVSELYAKRFGKVRKIERTKGNELNSRNFKVTAACGVYMVKQRPLSGRASAAVERKICRALKKRLIRCPESVRTDKAEYQAAFGGFLWSAAKFIRGKSYEGSVNALPFLWHAEIKLFESLSGMSDIAGSFPERSYFTRAEIQTVSWYA